MHPGTTLKTPPLASKTNGGTPLWLTEKQVAEMTGISVHTLRAWRLRGTGPSYVKISKLVRYSCDEIFRFMASHSVKTSI